MGRSSKFVIVTVYEKDNFYWTDKNNWSLRICDAKRFNTQGQAIKSMCEDITRKKMLGLPKVGRREFID